MLFRRRVAPTLRERIRVWLWPRHSWSRSAKYFAKRILRLTGSPHAVAAGVAAGMFAAFTPFVGLHFLLSFIVAFFIGGNMLAAALGTSIGNPLSFPFIWAATFKTGTLMLNEPKTEFVAPTLSRIWYSPAELLPVLKPMLVGSIPLGAAIGFLGYLLTRWALKSYQMRRRERLGRRLAERRAERLAVPKPAGAATLEKLES